jgi:hypothetical protein
MSRLPLPVYKESNIVTNYRPLPHYPSATSSLVACHLSGLSCRCESPVGHIRGTHTLIIILCGVSMTPRGTRRSITSKRPTKELVLSTPCTIERQRQCVESLEYAQAAVANYTRWNQHGRVVTFMWPHEVDNITRKPYLEPRDVQHEIHIAQGLVGCV